VRAFFRHTAFFIGANTREAVQSGRADYIPVFLSEIPHLIRSRRVRIDVALVQVSPPDAHGYVSLGVSVDVVRAAVDTAELVIAEVNPRMPRTHGDSFLHVDAIHRMVPVDAPLLERVAEPLDDQDDEIFREIGRNCATLIPDGATLQPGIGRVPDAVLAALADRRDLGGHTEMLSDGIMRLSETGAITGRRKTLLPGKMVTSFLMGSGALYAWAADHPQLEMRGSEFTNDPFTIARNDGMVSINSALAVDLTGQVAADSVKGGFYSGIGGQVDFIRGANRSRGGKAVIAMRSTAKAGPKKETISRICAAFDEGVGVVTSRGDVRYVVTEYGVADLWGKSVRERATALTAIAHPEFRAGLMDAARARHYVLPDQPLPRATWPWKEAASVRTVDGAELLLRPVSVADAERLQDFFYRMSDDSIYRRFLCHRSVHHLPEMQRLADLDDESSMGLVACVPASGEIVAMARYDVDPATRLADIAFAVGDEWQGRGLGTELMRRMTTIARARGLRGFSADVLARNKPMLIVFQRSGLQFQGRVEDGVYHMEARFNER
jgi:acyl-CoA hydrolase/RimJ/RimL family protein N-acetyltransferase